MSTEVYNMRENVRYCAGTKDYRFNKLGDEEATPTVEEDATKRSFVSPVERALDMVSDYCMEKVRNCFFSDGASEGYQHKSEAYFNVRNLIQDYIEMHRRDWERQREVKSEEDNEELNNYKKEAEWYKNRMEQYRKSFFMVCNLIDTCGVPESIKYFVKQEELRY